MEILLSWLIDNTLVIFLLLFLFSLFLAISPSPRDRTLLLLFTPVSQLRKEKPVEEIVYL